MTCDSDQLRHPPSQSWIEAARQADAEQCVDQLGRRCGRHDILNRSRPVGPRPNCALRFGFTESRDAHRHAQFQQAARDHIAVAAIVARTTKDQRLALHARTPDNVRRALTGAPHQRIGIGARIEQRLFGGAHLRDREDRRAHVRRLVRCQRRHASPILRRDE